LKSSKAFDVKSNWSARFALAHRYKLNVTGLTIALTFNLNRSIRIALAKSEKQFFLVEEVTILKINFFLQDGTALTNYYNN